jgi:hypothetical protein
MRYIISFAISVVVFTSLPSAVAAGQDNIVDTLHTGTLQVTIQKRATYQPVNLRVHVKTFKNTPMFISNRDDSKNHHTDWKLYTAIGVSLTSATAALMAERTANRAYDTYLTSAEPSRQDRYYRRAVRYDRLAGGLWTLFEIGFVATWYIAFF